MRRTAIALFVFIVLLSAAAWAGNDAVSAARAGGEAAPAGRIDLSGARADVPDLISYQGTLTDPAGVALDTTVMMLFSIYIDSTGMLSLWSEGHPAVTVESGVFNVFLGETNPLMDYLFEQPDLWLGLQVGIDPELRPLQRLAAVPFAFRAAEADTADYARGAPASADGDWTVSGSDIYSAVSGNVGVGKSSPAAKLDVAGMVSTDSAYQIGGETVLSVGGLGNVFVGENAGKNVNAYAFDNTFVGSRAGSTNTEGYYNAFFGAEAGRANTTGTSNTFIGNRAGVSNTGGGNNTFLGDGTGYNNTTGDRNTFIGQSAGANNSTGSDNVFIGYEAGHYHNEGNTNVFIGEKAGSFNATGAGNVFLGYAAGYHETGSNKLYIANGSDTSNVLIYGEFDSGRVGLGTLAPEARLDVAGTVNTDSVYQLSLIHI